jgi:hypothetical protein
MVVNYKLIGECKIYLEDHKPAIGHVDEMTFQTKDHRNQVIGDRMNLFFLYRALQEKKPDFSISGNPNNLDYELLFKDISIIGIFRKHEPLLPDEDRKIILTNIKVLPPYDIIRPEEQDKEKILRFNFRLFNANKATRKL